MMTEIIYLNGRLVPRSKARISVSDHGFLYGYGLFETMRAYNGRIFLLERHIKRLRGAAETIGLGESLAGIDLANACIDTVTANKLNDARLRLTVTNGDSEAFPWAGETVAPTVVVTARPYTPFPAEKYEQGFKIFMATVRRCRQSSVSGVKSTSYLISVLARVEAAAHGMDEALLLNDDGFIAEGSTSNVFFVKSGRLVTPSPGSGILPGITRGLVMELAGQLDITVTEGTVGLAILRQCDEAFLTASTLEIMPLASVSDESGRTVTIGSGKPGPITRQLMAAYKERVERETD
jgi:branched-chain amino acid aminotransferase